MKTIIVALLSSWCVFSFSAFAGDEPCECPKLGCDSCSLEKGVTFYTSKCGPGGARLKSCARPTCIPVDEATKECPVPPSAQTGPREPIVLKPAGAAVAKADVNDETSIVGRVKVISGSVSIVGANGQKSVVSGEGKLHETDTVESSADGGAVVEFEGGNKLHVHPNTAVQVKEFKDQKDPDSRKALLQLIKGKIRNQVEQKYNGKTSFYKVQTVGAVAGVRGTDFVIEHQEDTKLETRVEALGGKVLLASLDERETREILRGEGAAFSADLPDPSFKGRDYSEFIQRGKLSPVYKIPPDKLRELDMNSRVDVAKASGKKNAGEAEICDKPKARYNQCAWTCTEGGTGGEACRTCTRTRCNANGKWSDSTRLTGAAAKVACPASGITVKPCDY